MPAVDSVILRAALNYLTQGQVIAYPTEAVYGFGCDPFQSEAVARLLQIKQRQPNKGLILVAANWEQIESLIEPIPPRALAQVRASWPGPYTWAFPASQLAPSWIKGDHSTIALRISAHPVVQELCLAFGKPIVSTSANREGEQALQDFRAVQMKFGKELALIVPGKVSGLNRPTSIRNAVSGDIIRP